MSEIGVTVPEAAAIPQGPLLFYVDNRRRQMIRALIVFFVTTALIVFMSWGFQRASAGAPWWAFLSVYSAIAGFVYFDLLWILSMFHLIRPGPALILYEQGIYDRSLSKSIIPWQEIVRLRRTLEVPDWWLYFEVRDPGRCRRSMRLIQRLPSLIDHLTGRGTFVLKFAFLGGDREEALRYIIVQLATHGDPSNPPLVEDDPRLSRFRKSNPITSPPAAPSR